MADAVTSQVVNDGPKYHTVILTGVSDGTGEAAVVKVDLSALGGNTSGKLPTKLCVERIEYDVQGFAYVSLTFDRDTDQLIATLSGQGCIDWRSIGGKTDDGAGGTGDITLIAPAGATTGTYTITLHCRKKYG